MLTLKRKKRQVIDLLFGDQIVSVEVRELNASCCRLAIDAPPEVEIHRREKREKEAAESGGLAFIPLAPSLAALKASD